MSPAGGLLLRIPFIALATLVAAAASGGDAPAPLRLEGHTSLVRTVSFSPDGTLLASASFDGTVRLWNVRDGKLLKTLAGHQGKVSAAVFAPDGKTLASAGSDGSTRIWDVSSGAQRSSLGTGGRPVHCLAFRNDGKRLASAGEDAVICLWDPAEGKRVATLPPHPGTVLSLDFSPDGRTIVSGSIMNLLHYWDVESERETLRVEAHPGWVHSVLFAPDGRTVASGSGGPVGAIRIWKAGTASELKELDGHPANYVASLSFSGDGKLLASAGGKDGTFRLWEAATGREILRLQERWGFAAAVALSPDGKRLACGAEDPTIRLWDLDALLRLRDTGPGEHAPEKTMDGLWDDLAADDAARAYGAIRAMESCPKLAADYLAPRLKPAPGDGKEDAQIRALVETLDDEAFQKREDATRALIQIGLAAEPYLQEALRQAPSEEVKTRVPLILASLRGPVLSTEQLRAIRAIQVLERIGTDPARRVLETLSRGALFAPETQEARAALQRLPKKE